MKRIARMAIATTLVLVIVVLAGCTKATKTSPSASGPKKLIPVNFANVSATCEAPLFIALEKGFFKEEGLDVQTKAYTDFEVIKQALSADKNDAYLGNLEWIKPIEQGLDVKYVAGVHKGCIQGVAPKGSSIKSFKDLKGKRVGVNAMGDYPMVLTAKALADVGLDFKKDVDLKVYPGPNLQQALDKKEIDAYVMWDPFPQISLDSGKVQLFFSQAKDKPFADKFCCLLTVRGKLLKEKPGVVAALTRGLFKGAKWVGDNPDATAKIIVEKKYTSGSVPLVAKLLKQYDWSSDTQAGKASFLEAATAFKKSGFLDASTDVNSLVDKAYAPIDLNEPLEK